MSTTLHLVYQYRQLAGKCDLRGLDMAEVELLETIEALFSGCSDGRRHSAREDVAMRAQLRIGGRRHRVLIENLGLGGMVCHRARQGDVGDTVEIIIDDDELCLSYRFKARICWSTPGDRGNSFGLRFCGAPLLLRYAPPELEAPASQPASDGDLDQPTAVDADCAAA